VPKKDVVKKVIEDKTFGTKNKNKSKKMQQYIENLTKNTEKKIQGDGPSTKEIQRRKAEAKEAADRELGELVRMRTLACAALCRIVSNFLLGLAPTRCSTVQDGRERQQARARSKPEDHGVRILQEGHVHQGRQLRLPSHCAAVRRRQCGRHCGARCQQWAGAAGRV
jgi:hypothetical protein